MLKHSERHLTDRTTGRGKYWKALCSTCSTCTLLVEESTCSLTTLVEESIERLHPKTQLKKGFNAKSN